MTASEKYKKALQLAGKLHAQGQRHKAVATLERLLETGEQLEHTLRVLLQIYLDLNEHAKAISCLKALVKLKPNTQAYCDTLANLYVEDNNIALAIKCYEHYISGNPNKADAYYSLAQLQARQQHYQEALSCYKEALSKNITAAEEVYTNMSLIFSKLHMGEAVLNALQKALALNKHYIPALFNLASYYEEIGEMNSAEQYFEAVLSLAPKHYLALSRLAGVKKYDFSDCQLRERLSLAAKDSSTDALAKTDIHYALGKVLNDCKQYDQAFAIYQQANEHQKNIGGKAYDPQEQEKHITNIISAFKSSGPETIAPVSNAKVLFICGMFRSGSTLAEQILSAHSSVAAGGELDFFVRLVENQLSPFPASISSLDDKQRNDYAAAYLHYLNNRFPKEQLVTNKRPDNFLYIGLIKTLFPNARFIHTSRQPLDNCLSIYFSQLDSAMSYALDLKSIAHFSQQHTRLMNHWHQLFPGSIFEFNYERLVNEPKCQIQKMLKFCELDWEENCLNFNLNSNNVQTASAWQVRQPLYASSSNRWKNYKEHITPLLEHFTDST